MNRSMFGFLLTFFERVVVFGEAKFFKIGFLTEVIQKWRIRGPFPQFFFDVSFLSYFFQAFQLKNSS
jgi:hypothetical protein